MSLLAFALTLLSACFWAFFDASRKALTESLPVRVVTFWVAASSLPLYCAWALHVAEFPRETYWGPATLSAVLNLGANGLFVFAVSRAPLGRAVPMLAWTPVCSALAAALFLGESFGAPEFIGAALVTAGAWGVGRRPRGTSEKEEESKVRVGIWAMLGVALLWSLTTVFDKAALSSAPAAFHGFWLNGVQAALLLPFAVRGRGVLALLPSTPKAKLWLLAGGLTSFAALSAQFLALETLPVGLFEAMKRGINLGLAVIVGRFVFREVVTLRQVLGVATMAVGVVVITQPEGWDLGF